MHVAIDQPGYDSRPMSVHKLGLGADMAGNVVPDSQNFTSLHGYRRRGRVLRVHRIDVGMGDGEVCNLRMAVQCRQPDNHHPESTSTHSTNIEDI